MVNYLTKRIKFCWCLIFITIYLLHSDKLGAQPGPGCSGLCYTVDKGTPTGGGTYSLNDAITWLNSQPAPATNTFYEIKFALGTLDPSGKGWRITLSSALPEINRPVFINGFSQSISGTSAYLDLMIIIDFNDMHGDGIVLGPGSEGSTIQGLVLYHVNPDIVNTYASTQFPNLIQVNSNGVRITNNVFLGDESDYQNTNQIIRGRGLNNGIKVTSNSVEIMGNMFGFGSDFPADICLNPNGGASGLGNAIWLDGADNCLIGSDNSNLNFKNNFVDNIVSIYMTNSNNTVINGNIFGCDINGDNIIHNGNLGRPTLDVTDFSGVSNPFINTGISANNCIDLNIGSPSTNHGNIFGLQYIAIQLINCNFNIRNNNIGTDVTGLIPAGNNFGIYLGSSEGTIGGIASGEGNMISGNNAGICGGGLSDVTNSISILGNKIGVDLNNRPVNTSGSFRNSHAITFEGTGDNNDQYIIGDGSINGRNIITDYIEFNNCRNITIRRNFIGNDGTDQIGNGIIYLANSPAIIGGPTVDDGNIISGIYLNGSGAILAVGNSYNINNGLLIENNQIGISPPLSIGYHAISAITISDFNSNVNNFSAIIRNNNILAYRGQGIYIQNCIKLNIEGNKIGFNNTGSPYGILVQGLSYSRIYNNEIKDQVYGIYINSGLSRDLIIELNTIENCGIGIGAENGGSAVNLEFSHSNIVNNTFQNINSFGLFFKDNVSYNHIFSNSFIDIGEDAISIEGSSSGSNSDHNWLTENTIVSTLSNYKGINLKCSLVYAGNICKPRPIITSIHNGAISGTSQANDIIEIFRNTSTFLNSNQCAEEWAGRVTANAIGTWSWTDPQFLSSNVYVATATTNPTSSTSPNNTSELGHFEDQCGSTLPGIGNWISMNAPLNGRRVTCPSNFQWSINGTLIPPLTGGLTDYSVVLQFVALSIDNTTGRLVSDWTSATSITYTTNNFSSPFSELICSLITANNSPQNFSWRVSVKYGANSSDKLISPIFQFILNSNDNLIPEENYLFSSAHTNNINWIYGINYLENGKTSESIAYIDGLGKGRQVQSRINSNATDKIMCIEAAQSEEGGGAAVSLPAPIGGNAFGYAFKFFDVYKNGVWSDFSTIDFDADNITTHEIATPTLLDNSISGSVSNFYSDHNPDYYIDDAQGYPYTFSIGNKSPLQRIYKAEAGAGDTYKMGGEREISYYYGKPAQTELDRVFGKNLAPKEDEISQTIVFDPDRVGNITYKDNEGKTIATALTSCNSTLNPLDASHEEGLNHPLIININPLKNNQDDPTTLARNSSSTFFIDCDKDIIFNYSVDLSSFVVNGIGCQDCKFHVNVALINQNTGENVSVTGVLPIDQNLIPSLACSSGTQTVHLASNVQIPLTGPAMYKVVRTITPYVDPATGSNTITTITNGFLDWAVTNRPAILNTFETQYFTDEKYYVLRKVLSEAGNPLTSLQTMSWRVTTYSGTEDECATDGPLNVAEYYNPRGITEGYSGKKYIADGLNHCIRIVNPPGLVSVFAGQPCNPGNDDGLGTNASFFDPYDVCFIDYALNIPHGHLPGFIAVADRGNNLIRKIELNGNVTTLAGSLGEFLSPEGIGTDNSRFGQHVFVASSGNNKIFKVDDNGTVTVTLIAGTGSSGNQDGAIGTATFNHPSDVAVDQNGNLYVADRDNNCIRFINLVTNQVSTIFGDGVQDSKNGFGTAASFNSPVSIYFSPGYNYLYVTDQGENKIRQIDMATHEVVTIAGDGFPSGPGFNDDIGLNAKFNTPQGLYVNSSNEVFVADVLNNRIRRLIWDIPNVTPVATKSLIPYADEVNVTDVSLPNYSKRLSDLDADVNSDGIPGPENYNLSNITTQGIPASSIVADFITAYNRMHLVHLSTSSSSPPYIDQMELFSVDANSELNSSVIQVFDAETGFNINPADYQPYSLLRVKIIWDGCEQKCPEEIYLPDCPTTCDEQRSAYYYEMLDAYDALATQSAGDYSAYGYPNLLDYVNHYGVPLNSTQYDQLLTAPNIKNFETFPSDQELYLTYENARDAYSGFNVQDCINLCLNGSDPCASCQTNYSSCVFEEMDILTQGYEYLMDQWTTTFPFTLDQLRPYNSTAGTRVNDPDLIDRLGTQLFNYIVQCINTSDPVLSNQSYWNTNGGTCNNCNAPANITPLCSAAAPMDMSNFPSLLIPLLDFAITDAANPNSCQAQYGLCFQLNDPGTQDAAACAQAYTQCSTAASTLTGQDLVDAMDVCDNSLNNCTSQNSPVRLEMIRVAVSNVFPDISQIDFNTIVSGIQNDTYTKTLEELIIYLEDYESHMRCVLACQDQLEDAFFEYYSNYINGTINQIREDWITNCQGNLNENMNISYSQNYYHYTLYYYDAANNLVKIIPPEGVDYIDVNDVDLSRSNRDPQHRMETKYEYNSLYKLTVTTPDEGKTRYLYDVAGRLRFYQTAEQRTRFPNGNFIFNYIHYDDAGRVVGTGEYQDHQNILCCWSFADGCSCIDVKTIENYVNVYSWPFNNLFENTYYSYDSPYLSLVGYNQSYLNGRLGSSQNNNSITYYSYDAHGRVKFVVQRIQGLVLAPGGPYKTIDYKYDELTGQINEIIYQKGKQEEFHHFYTYDADGRLFDAKVSRHDQASSALPLASYDYSDLGQIKNVSLGDNIQNLDYVYNINGLLKAINNPIPNPLGTPFPNDEDGTAFSKDVFAEVLNYFHGDFNRPGVGLDPSAKATPQSSSAILSNSPPLTFDRFNGNISNIVTQTGFDQTTSSTSIPNLMMQAYKYDVLHRLNDVYVETNNAAALNPWGTSMALDEPLGTHITYDGNGNILTLTRNALSRISGGVHSFQDPTGAAVTVTVATTEMDDLEYKYAQTVLDFNGKTKITNNRLATVKDFANHETRFDDILNGAVGYSSTDTATHNYTYDNNGRIITDDKNGIVRINWNSFNKISSVKFNSANGNKLVVYSYNGQHQRIVKYVSYPPPNYQQSTTTYYAYDGSGLLMASYERYYEIGTGTEKWRLNELDTYAASRVGVYDLNEVLLTSPTSTADYEGHLRFEICDHIGSIRAVVTGLKDALTGNADILSLHDYYEFGMTMGDRTFDFASGYKYGYQGSENETGMIGMYNTEFRLLDVRLGRWFTPDPIMHPSMSPYNSMDNDPIGLTDVLGLEGEGIPDQTLKEVNVTATRIYHGFNPQDFAGTNQIKLPGQLPLSNRSQIEVKPSVPYSPGQLENYNNKRAIQDKIANIFADYLVKTIFANSSEEERKLAFEVLYYRTMVSVDDNGKPNIILDLTLIDKRVVLNDEVEGAETVGNYIIEKGVEGTLKIMKSSAMMVKASAQFIGFVLSTSELDKGSDTPFLFGEQKMNDIILNTRKYILDHSNALDRMGQNDIKQIGASDHIYRSR
jgi:RHS repeat-associated protein